MRQDNSINRVEYCSCLLSHDSRSVPQNRTAHIIIIILKKQHSFSSSDALMQTFDKIVMKSNQTVRTVLSLISYFTYQSYSLLSRILETDSSHMKTNSEYEVTWSLFENLNQYQSVHHFDWTSHWISLSAREFPKTMERKEVDLMCRYLGMG